MVIVQLRCLREKRQQRPLIDVGLGEGRLIITNNAGDLALGGWSSEAINVSAVLADAVHGRRCHTVHLETIAANQNWE
jgi:hypothetical protein